MGIFWCSQRTDVKYYLKDGNIGFIWKDILFELSHDPDLILVFYILSYWLPNKL